MDKATRAPIRCPIWPSSCGTCLGAHMVPSHLHAFWTTTTPSKPALKDDRQHGSRKCFGAQVRRDRVPRTPDGKLSSLPRCSSNRAAEMKLGSSLKPPRSLRGRMWRAQVGESTYPAQHHQPGNSEHGPERLRPRTVDSAFSEPPVTPPMPDIGSSWRDGTRERLDSSAARWHDELCASGRLMMAQAYLSRRLYHRKANWICCLRCEIYH